MVPLRKAASETTAHVSFFLTVGLICPGQACVINYANILVITLYHPKITVFYALYRARSNHSTVHPKGGWCYRLDCVSQVIIPLRFLDSHEQTEATILRFLRCPTIPFTWMGAYSENAIIDQLFLNYEKPHQLPGTKYCSQYLHNHPFIIDQLKKNAISYGCFSPAREGRITQRAVLTICLCVEKHRFAAS